MGSRSRSKLMVSELASGLRVGVGTVEAFGVLESMCEVLLAIVSSIYELVCHVWAKRIHCLHRHGDSLARLVDVCVFRLQS